jgi:hypothetical protein
MRGMHFASLPQSGGEGDHPKGGGGVAYEASGNDPSTMLRMVPLPICDGEAK